MLKRVRVFSILFLLIFSLLGIAESLAPKKASAILVCSQAYNPRIRIDIEGQSFERNGAISVPSGTVVSFTVFTYSEPSSPNSVSHPFGFGRSYSGPLSSGRYYETTRAITSSDGPQIIHVNLGFNCEYDGSDPPPDADVTITINVESAPPPTNNYLLTVSKGGTGSGTVTGTGISCGSDCSESYTSGTSVTLNASPASGSNFGGWSGACSGTGSCTVSMTVARTVTATFNAAPPPPPGSHTLSVSKSGTGSGTLTSSPSGINCGATCSKSYTSGTSVSLTAAASSGSTFAGWGGSCSGTGSCTVSMTASRSVTATFNLVSGSCTEDASVNLYSPPPATLTPGQSYTFAFTATNIGQTSWFHGSGFEIQKTAGPTVVANTCRNGSYLGTTDFGQVCNISTPTNGIIQDWTFSGTAPTTPGNYTVTMQMEHNPGYDYKLPSGSVCAPRPASPVRFGNTVSGTFTVVQSDYLLTASVDSGSGTVNSTGINCPGDCSETFLPNTWVTIIATQATDYVFTSWNGACAGQGSSCSLRMDSDKSTGANFTYAPPFNYSLSNPGNVSVIKTSGDAYGQNTISKLVIGSATQPVSLTVAGVPSGTTYSVANDPCSPTCSSTITFTVSPSTTVGTHPITVTGAPLGKQTSFNLLISGNPSSVTCSASPATALLGETVNWTANVTGGTPPYTYQWSGTNIPVPAPITNPYRKSYSTIGAKNASVVVTDSDGIISTCPAATVQINFDPNFEEF